ncbi:MAG: hypothetical protein KA392_08085 [Candidatus Obscuribacter sp.]|jgi:hypothetical protein|nr:hypothetical protein [Candidatus Obscuribacter sp.]MBP6593767.1 hypothetical protein [Candidatus Obscuribacter sp.]
MSTYRYFFCGPCGALAKANAAHGIGLSTIIWAPLSDSELLHCGQWANAEGLQLNEGCGARASIQALIDDYVSPLSNTQYQELPSPTDSDIETTSMLMRWKSPQSWADIKDAVRANREDLTLANDMFTKLFLEIGCLDSHASTDENFAGMPDFSKFRLALDVFDKLVQEVDDDDMPYPPEDGEKQAESA